MRDVYRDQDLRIRRWRGHNQGRNSKLDQYTTYEGQTKIRCGEQKKKNNNNKVFSFYIYEEFPDPYFVGPD